MKNNDKLKLKRKDYEKKLRKLRAHLCCSRPFISDSTSLIDPSAPFSVRFSFLKKQRLQRTPAEPGFFTALQTKMSVGLTSLP